VLFRIPRTPATEGVRSIGRLALCDHYHEVTDKIRTALEAFVTPAKIEEAEKITRLGIRSTFPRMYVAAGLSGGTGSGMFIDIAYLIRREAARLGFNNPNLIGVLGIPAFARDLPDSNGVANARAALVELSHFGKSPYQAQFDAREGRIREAERPFRRCTLVSLPGKYDRTDRERASAVAAHATYGDMFTPLGRAAYPDDAPPMESPLSIVGIQRVVWPRAQVVRTAGRLLAQKILATWVVKAEEGVSRDIPRETIETQWTTRQLDFASLRATLDAHLTKTLGGTPQECIVQALRTFNERTDGESGETIRVRKAFLQLLNLVGSPGLDDCEHPHSVGTALAAKVQELASQSDSRLQSVIMSLIEQPGLRVAGGEEALEVLRQKINQEALVVEREAIIVEEQAYALFAPLHNQLVVLAGESNNRFARPGSASEALNALRHWAYLRWQTLIIRACGRVYNLLLGGVPDHTRGLNAIRGQMQSVQKQFTDVTPGTTAEDGVYRAVFPGGARTVLESAKKFVDALPAADVREFENSLQARIRHECRGVVALLSRSRDATTNLMSVMTDHAVRFLETRIPHAGACQVVSLHSAPSSQARERLTELLAAATPIGLSPGAPTLTILAVPEESGPVREVVRELCAGNIVRNINSPDDMLFWRECRGLTLASFPHLAAEQPNGTHVPHTRTDITWLPPSGN
jgi:hypothetical protein